MFEIGMNSVFDRVAECLQLQFGNGKMERETVTEILTVLACALMDEGWYVEAVNHSLEKFKDWPIITKALRTALGI